MALSYGILKKTSKADLVGTLVVCVPILTVMLLVSASPFATYTACKVICAFFLADFSVAENDGAFRMARRFYRVATWEAARVKALMAGVLLLIVAITSCALSSSSQILPMLAACLGAFAYGFVWSFVMGEFFVQHRVTSLWTFLFGLLPAISVIPLVYGTIVTIRIWRYR
ncbi:putative membrane protein YeiB [Olsenella profusa DSM 13989]|uniref:hypothetical protein n=1 Tax=Olsenella profusa TaxID=138595 RepID=UPI0027840BCE|nr:hypothetical protein [Olsenella profusa]MDP9860530.1 putative membrane protein YeiB [Olsenella profusa DSM 13989]